MNVTFYSKSDFADVTEFKILRRGDHPGLSGQAQCNHEGPYQRDLWRVRIREESNAVAGAETGERQLEGGGKGSSQGVQAASKCRKL